MEKCEVMDQVALKLINDHRRNLQKFPTPPKKLLLPENKPNEDAQISTLFESLKDVLNTDRVERRCARSKANWLSDRCLAKVLKVNKSLLAHFGYQDCTGKFLHPEETLFLLETNRLELFWNEIPVTIQQAYSLVIDDTNITFARYNAYKKLVLQGLIVTKPKKPDDESTKRSCEASETIQPHKKVCGENISGVGSIEGIFNKLRSEGPKMNPINRFFKVDYKVQVPNSEQKEVNLFISTDDVLSSHFGWSETAKNDIIAVSNQNTLRYYQFTSVELPEL